MGDLLGLLQALAILLTAVLAYRAIRGEVPNLRIVRADCVDGVATWRGDSTVACHVRLFVVNLSGRGNAIVSTSLDQESEHGRVVFTHCDETAQRQGFLYYVFPLSDGRKGTVGSLGEISSCPVAVPAYGTAKVDGGFYRSANPKGKALDL